MESIDRYIYISQGNISKWPMQCTIDISLEIKRIHMIKSRSMRKEIPLNNHMQHSHKPSKMSQQSLQQTSYKLDYYVFYRYYKNVCTFIAMKKYDSQWRNFPICTTHVTLIIVIGIIFSDIFFRWDCRRPNRYHRWNWLQVNYNELIIRGWYILYLLDNINGILISAIEFPTQGRPVEYIELGH